MMTAFTSGLPCEPVHEEPEERELIVEWWEVWWEKEGCPPILKVPYGVPADTRIPSHGFVSRQEAKDFLVKENNKYLKIKHVRRTRKKK